MKIKVLVKRTKEVLIIDVKDFSGVIIWGNDEKGNYRRLRRNEIEIIEE